MRRALLEQYEKAFNNVPKLKAIFLFFFSKTDFLALSTKHDIGLSLSNNQKREKFEEGAYNPDEARAKSQASQQTDRLRRSLFHSFLLVAGTSVLAIYIGALLSEIFGLPSLKLVRTLQVIGAGSLLWATLWEMGWDLRTWSGESLPERVHHWIFRGFYITGTFCLFLSVVW